MKLKRTVAACIVGVILLVAGAAFCDEKVSMSEWNQIVEQMGTKGNINWSEGYVEAVGIGAPPEQYIGKPNARPMALRAATVDAYRNLLEIVNGVRIDATTVVKDFVTQSDVINAQVQGLVKGAKEVKKEYLSDGTVEVTLRMSLSGDFAKVIVPKILEKTQTPLPAPETPRPAAPVTAPPAAPAGVVYTGLVIDARGLQARPAMSPKILDEDGKEVYGSMNVDREYAVQQGMSGYARDLTAAQSNSRVTNNPVTVKGLKADGQGRSDIVISNADASAIRGAADNLTFLKKCRVMVVLD